MTISTKWRKTWKLSTIFSRSSIKQSKMATFRLSFFFCRIFFPKSWNTPSMNWQSWKKSKRDWTLGSCWRTTSTSSKKTWKSSWWKELSKYGVKWPKKRSWTNLSWKKYINRKWKLLKKKKITRACRKINLFPFYSPNN